MPERIWSNRLAPRFVLMQPSEVHSPPPSGRDRTGRGDPTAGPAVRFMKSPDDIRAPPDHGILAALNEAPGNVAGHGALKLRSQRTSAWLRNTRCAAVRWCLPSAGGLARRKGLRSGKLSVLLHFEEARVARAKPTLAFAGGQCSNTARAKGLCIDSGRPRRRTSAVGQKASTSMARASKAFPHRVEGLKR